MKAESQAAEKEGEGAHFLCIGAGSLKQFCSGSPGWLDLTLQTRGGSNMGDSEEAGEVIGASVSTKKHTIWTPLWEMGAIRGQG